MRKMIFGLMVAFYLGGLVGCAEWAAGDRQAGRVTFRRREAATSI